MPLYEYLCRQCDREQELLVRGDESPECERCGSDKLLRLLSVPAAHAAETSTAMPPQGSCGTGCGCFPQ